VRTEPDESEPTCPSCGHLLERLGDEETGLDDTSNRTRAYVCPSGCRGPTGEGTFEFAECPVCGSHDTTRGASRDGAEELECLACGAIVTAQMYRPGGLS
jgi:uncharacterized C2H2 Zn-finger protein